MSLNIKNEHVHDLAREAARRTGRSQTSVIEDALEQLLERLTADAAGSLGRAAAIRDVVVDIQNRLTDEVRAELSSDVLYDDRGLPA